MLRRVELPAGRLGDEAGEGARMLGIPAIVPAPKSGAAAVGSSPCAATYAERTGK